MSVFTLTRLGEIVLRVVACAEVAVNNNDATVPSVYQCNSINGQNKL